MTSGEEIDYIAAMDPAAVFAVSSGSARYPAGRGMRARARQHVQDPDDDEADEIADHIES
jgi:hypothetical protein